MSRSPHRVAPLALALLASAAACRTHNSAPDGTRPAESTAGVTNAPGGSGAGAASARGARGERVTFHSADGWTLVGDLVPGVASRPSVVLLHQLSSNRGEWAPLVARLHAGTAYTTLAIDGRGHGESTLGPDGAMRWTEFGNDPARWDGLRRDLAAAISFLRGQNLATQGIVLVGSSIGATAAIRAAVDTTGVRGVVMLSPGLDYRGLDAREPFTRYVRAGGVRVFLAAGDGDTGSAECVRALERDARPASEHASLTDGGRLDAGVVDPDLVRAAILPGSGAHGVALGAPAAHPALWDEIAGWLDRLALAPVRVRENDLQAPGEPDATAVGDAGPGNIRSP
ncbi:MAG: alpha/beta fold hydrolase [Deltaproteobacteria bacterium]